MSLYKKEIIVPTLKFEKSRADSLSSNPFKLYCLFEQNNILSIKDIKNSLDCSSFNVYVSINCFLKKKFIKYIGIKEDSKAYEFIKE